MALKLNTIEIRAKSIVICATCILEPDWLLEHKLYIKRLEYIQLNAKVSVNTHSYRIGQLGCHKHKSLRWGRLFT